MRQLLPAGDDATEPPQVGLFLGLLENASVTIENTDANLWVTSNNTPNVDFSQTFPETHVPRVRSIPGVARADDLVVWFMNTGLPTGAQELSFRALRGKTTYVLVKLAPGADVAAVRAENTRRLPFDDAFTKSEWAARSRAYWVANTGIGLNMYLTVFLGVLVGVVVVARTP